MNIRKLKRFSYFELRQIKHKQQKYQNNMELYEGDKYFTTQNGVKSTLDKFGVAIIPGVLNQDECDAMNVGAFDYLETVTSEFDTPIRRKDQTTWRELNKLWVKHSMLMQHWKIGHAQYVWDVRQNPKVYNTFATLWDTPADDLLVSFDGASIHFPPEITKRGWFRGNTWLHSDQSFTRNELECIQAWVTANTVNVGDATLAFMEGSHKLHAEVGKHFEITDKSDWYKITEEQMMYYKDKGCELHYIRCPAGSMVLWDSRTIHCGQEAMKTRAMPNTRNIVYVCYTPRTLATKASLTKKQKAFNEMRTTSHWPHKPKLFPVNPRTYGQKIAEIADILPPNVSDIGRRMAGF